MKMNVRELIEQLTAYEMNTEVMIEDYDGYEQDIEGIYGTQGWGKGILVLSLIKKENVYVK